MMESLKAWLWNILIAIDQLANVIFAPVFNLFVMKGGHLYGAPDETISSVSGKNYEARTCLGCTILCHVLNIFEEDHCLKSIEADELAAIKAAAKDRQNT